MPGPRKRGLNRPSKGEYLDPARSIIARLGGVAIVARVTGRDPTRVFRWMYPAGRRGGTGGRIPANEIPKLVAYAQKKGKRLSHAEFFPG